MRHTSGRADDPQPPLSVPCRTALRKPELLAPAGKEEVFHAVLDAGADAVYLAGKQFNMRRHRKDFNFTEDALRRVVAAAHARGRKVYITVNTLIGPGELAELKRYLHGLADLGPDALIVQDFAVVHLCHTEKLPLVLHASTMMNVGSPEAARFLKRYGFTRVVPSRDITIDEARRIREQAGIEIEYFVNGDMCSVQSGQCCTSGILFGKSSNRGQCLKPCRWAYDLVSANSGEKLAAGAHLLAAKDLCLLQQIPELVQAGIDAFKIEGRMKPAEVLARIVGAYRAAIDRQWAEPLQPAKRRDEAVAMHQHRIRDLTTGFAFRTPGPDYFDLPAERELVNLSSSGTLPPLSLTMPLGDRAAYQGSLKGERTREPLPTAAPPGARRLQDVVAGESHSCTTGDPPGVGCSTPAGGSPAVPEPEITCVVGTAAGAAAAMDAGATNLILSWEGDLRSESAWDLATLAQLLHDGAGRNVRLILNSPKILTERELGDWRRALAALPALRTVCISHCALLEADLCAGRELWIDHTFNVINPAAAAFLAAHGAVRLMPGVEAAFAEVAALAAAPGLPPLDVLVHGPLTGMIVEHCLPAMATQHISKRDFCQMPCATEHYQLVDARGNRRPIRCDRYCRNHILLEREVGILPFLCGAQTHEPAPLEARRLHAPVERMVPSRGPDPALPPGDRAAYRDAAISRLLRAPGIAGWRIDARLYSPEKTAALVAFYRRAAAAATADAALVAEFLQLCPADTLTLGAYPRGITADDTISLVSIKQQDGA